MISFRRLLALMQKERREMLREPSNVLIGIVLPVVLLIIFGFGLSLDVKNIRVCAVVPRANAKVSEACGHFRQSDYFVFSAARDEQTAAKKLADRSIDAMLVAPQHPGTLAAAGRQKIQLILNATNASIVRSYQSAILQTLDKVKALFSIPKSLRTLQPVEARTRMWFNPSNNSAWFLVPGVIVIIMAMIGCMLTAMQVAKEYEHGTMESLFATPVSPTEILLAKMGNNFILGMVGLVISLVFSRFVFGVPMHGSLVWVLVGSSLFLLSQMALGLVISSATKSQFVAAQTATLLSFLPVFYLSGFIYEIPNMPDWMQYVTYVLPARYFVEFLLTSFLVGDVWTIYVRDLLPMLAFTVVFLVWARKLNPKVAQS